VHPLACTTGKAVFLIGWQHRSASPGSNLRSAHLLPNGVRYAPRLSCLLLCLPSPSWLVPGLFNLARLRIGDRPSQYVHELIDIKGMADQDSLPIGFILHPFPGRLWPQLATESRDAPDNIVTYRQPETPWKCPKKKKSILLMKGPESFSDFDYT